MIFTVDRIDVWLAHLDDVPGALGQLLTSLTQAGANLEFLFARPIDEGKALVFVAPLKGAQQIKVAKTLGLTKLTQMRSLRVQGPNRRGLGAKITQALGNAGINLAGFSAIGLGSSCLFYIALAQSGLGRAQKILKTVLEELV
jgi:hypothetical protein